MSLLVLAMLPTDGSGTPRDWLDAFLPLTPPPPPLAVEVAFMPGSGLRTVGQLAGVTTKLLLPPSSGGVEGGVLNSSQVFDSIFTGEAQAVSAAALGGTYITPSP